MNLKANSQLYLVESDFRVWKQPCSNEYVVIMLEAFLHAADSQPDIVSLVVALVRVSALDVWVGVSGSLPLHLCGSLMRGSPGMLLFPL